MIRDSITSTHDVRDSQPLKIADGVYLIPFFNPVDNCPGKGRDNFPKGRLHSPPSVILQKCHRISSNLSY